MEIERKYLILHLPEHLTAYPCRIIEQGYLNTNPVIRIRRDNDRYELTYKSGGLMTREEYNLPLTKEAYHHLLPKIDGRLIQKKRFMIPLDEHLTAELDILLLSFSQKSNSPQRKKHFLSFPRTGSAKTSPFPGNITTAI